MALPASTPIELNEILTEFGAPERTPLSAMVRGGAYVPDDDISGENSGIPTSTPIQLSDFLSANGNPNPYQIKGEFLTPVQNGTPFNTPAIRLLSNKRYDGLSVEAHDGDSSVPAAAQFVMDLKVRVGPNGITEPDSGAITGTENHYSNLQRVMGFRIGITTSDPATSSLTAMYNTMIGWEINFYDTEEETGVATVALGSPSIGWNVSGISGNANIQGTGFIESSDSTYEDDILPTKTNYVNLRLERGEPTNTITGSSKAPDWILTVYDDDTWSNTHQVVAAANGNTAFNQVAGLGGWLIMGTVPGVREGNLEMELGDVRVYVGGQSVPW